MSNVTAVKCVRCGKEPGLLTFEARESTSPDAIVTARSFIVRCNDCEISSGLPALTVQQAIRCWNMYQGR